MTGSGSDRVRFTPRRQDAKTQRNAEGGGRTEGRTHSSNRVRWNSFCPAMEM